MTNGYVPEELPRVIPVDAGSKIARMPKEAGIDDMVILFVGKQECGCVWSWNMDRLWIEAKGLHPEAVQAGAVPGLFQETFRHHWTGGGLSFVHADVKAPAPEARGRGW